MRRTIATLGVVGLGIMAATVSANAAPTEAEKKITICHATMSAGNPFVTETINLSALKAHADDTLDIVPVNAGDIFPNGQNLSSTNLVILANGCAEVAVPPVDETPKPVDQTPSPVAEAPSPVAEAPSPAAETPKPVAEAPSPAAETPAAVTTPNSALTQAAPTVVVPNAAVPAQEAAATAKKANVGYNVQTAVARTADTGIPGWLMALTGVLTAGAAIVLWQADRRARNSGA